VPGRVEGPAFVLQRPSGSPGLESRLDSGTSAPGQSIPYSFLPWRNASGHKTSRKDTMAIRPRGTSWQVDVRLVDGSRLRRTYATLEAAQQAELDLRPSPQQRSAAKKKRSKRSSARNGKPQPGQTHPSAEQSSNIAEPSPQPKSNLITLRQSPPSSPTCTPAPDTPTSIPSQRGCEEPAPPAPVPDSHAHPAPALANAWFRRPSLKGR
jgi:hypothetical protein